MSKYLFVATTLISLAGCANVPEVIFKCPVYFQENIGEIHQEISPFVLVCKGYVSVKEKEHPVHLYWKNKNTLLHETFHSFEFRAGDNNKRYSEWEKFYLDFHSIDNTDYKDYGGLVSSALLLNIPFIEYLQVKGKANFRSTISHFEDSAECFVFLMNEKEKKTKDKILQKKCDAVWKFVNGGYVN